MSRKRSKLTKNQIRYIALSAAVATLVVVGILLAMFLPTMKANSGLKDIFADLSAMNDPVMVITDMKADNTFSEARGEIIIDDASSTELFIKDILSLSEKINYDGKASAGTWNIRVRIYDEERSVELYFGYGKMYYVKNDVKYIFVPNEEVEEAYNKMYKTFEAFVR